MYKNKAFISYRHVPHDAEVARLVQKNLEQFRIPRGIRAAGRKRQLGRIFRDKTDLGTRTDLTEELQRELDDSEYLIVICSPDAAQSRWVPEEISYFLLHHGSDRILPVLSAGDPEVVYEALFRHSSGAPREPVACDFRGDPRQAVREELPRLISTLIGCTYDELVNRTRRREKKNTAIIVSAAAAVVLLLSSVAVFFAVSGFRARRMLRAQQKEDSRLLAEMSSAALSRGERFEAIRCAMEGVPDEGENRPASAEAVLALQEATGVYRTDTNGALTQTGEFLVDGEIIVWESAQTDAGTFLAALSGSGENAALKIWNIGTATDTGRLIYDTAAGGTVEDNEDNEDREDKENRISQDGTAEKDAMSEFEKGDDYVKVLNKGRGFGIFPDEIPDSLLFTDHALLWTRGSEIVKIDLETGEETSLQMQYISVMPVDHAAGKTAVWAYGKKDADLLILDEDGGILQTVSGEELALTEEGRRQSAVDTEAAADADGRDDTDDADDADGRDGTDDADNRDGTDDADDADGRDGTDDADDADDRDGADDADDADEAGGAQKASGPRNHETVSFDILDFQREAKLSPDGKYLFLHGSVSGTGAEEEEVICALDTQTKEMTAAVQGQEIPKFCICGESTVLALVYEGPVQERLRKGEDDWNGASSEEGELTLTAADCRGDRIVWQTESACPRNIDPWLAAGEKIPGRNREYAILTAGTMAEIYDTDTGERIYTAEFPGFISSVYNGRDGDGNDALMAVLEDGTISAFCYGDGRMKRKVTQIPPDMVRPEKTGDLLLAQYKSDERTHTGNRILAFRSGVSDAGFRRVETDGEAGDVFWGEKTCEAAKTWFIVFNENGTAAVFDAFTGEIVTGNPEAEEFVNSGASRQYSPGEEYGLWSGNGRMLAAIRDQNTILITDKKGNLKDEIKGAGTAIAGLGWLGDRLFWAETAEDGLWLCDEDGRIAVDTADNISDIGEETGGLTLTEKKGEMIARFHNTLFRIDLDSFALSGRIHNVLGYNPETDTLMLEEEDEDGVHVYISDLYSPMDLRAIGDRILDVTE